MDDDRFTFPFDLGELGEPSGELGELGELQLHEQPQFKVHDLVEYHPDPNKQPYACVVVDVHPVLTGQGALYGIAFDDGSMRVGVPQYDIHPLPNIVF